MVVLWLLTGQSNAQKFRKPEPLGNAPTFNAFVESCFALYGNTASIKSRIDALQLAVQGNTADFSTEKILAELDDCKNRLTNTAPAISNLISSCGDASSKFKDEIGTNPFRILNAGKQIKNSLGALNESRETVTVLLSAITGIKGTVKEKTGADTSSKPAQPGMDNTVLPLPATEMTTIVTVENITYTGVQEALEALKSNANVKSADKTFGGSKGVFTIVHSGNSDALLDFIMGTPFGKKTEVQELGSGQIKLKVK